MRFDMGTAMGRAFSNLFANFIPYVVITVVCFAPLVIMVYLLARNATEESARTLLIVTTVGTLLLQMVVTGAVTYGVVQSMAGKRASIGDCLGEGFSRMFPVLGVALVTGIGIMLGMLALIVPGLILMAMWYVAVPAAVVERSGVGGALERSSALTKGHRWEIFAMALIVGIVGNVASRVLSAASDGMTPLIATCVLILGGAFVGLYGSVLQAVTYSLLRGEIDGVEIEELAATFD